MGPWETPISGFFVRSHHGLPTLPEKDWVLKIDGLVDHPLTITLSELKKMKTTTFHAVLECSGNGRGLQKPTVPGAQWQKWAVGNAEWTGVAVAELLKQAGVQSEAKFARLEGTDEAPFPTVPKFIRSIPISKLEKADTLLAWKMNREPMPPLHGGPLRLILPGWYGENWMKWLAHITLTHEEDTGFYQQKGYRMPKTPVKPGEPWDSATGNPIEQLRVQSFIVSPSNGQTIAGGKVEIHGKTFSGAGPVEKVELSTDSGKTWQKAVLEPMHSDGGWQEFSFQAEGVPEGPLTLLSRATDSTGATQPMEAEWNPSGYLRHCVDRVTLNVSKEGWPVSVFRSKCLTCHSEEMTQSQRLLPKQWEATLKKMEKFGVNLTSTERSSLLSYLIRFSPDLPPAELRVTEWGRETSARLPLDSKGSITRGAQLFQKNCIACHGQEGQGLLGPRLIGRAVPVNEFWVTVLQGKRSMPGFSSKLKSREIADIRTFLDSTPTKSPVHR